MKKEENVLKYETAVEDIKNAILQSQHKAIKNANKELLQLYFKIGEYVSRNSRNGFWGRGGNRNHQHKTTGRDAWFTRFFCYQHKTYEAVL